MGSGEPTEFVKAEDDPIRDYAYWNTPLNGGVTRRQRKYAVEAGVPATLAVLADLPCLGGDPKDGPSCIAGSCVTCEAHSRRAENASLRSRHGLR